MSSWRNSRYKKNTPYHTYILLFMLVMADEIDSRTAAFDRKRRPDDFDDPDAMVASKKSRMSPVSSTGQTPKMTWNAGTKARIRTTLGGPRLGQRPSSSTENDQALSLSQQIQSPPSISSGPASIDEAKDSVVLNLAHEQSIENNIPPPQSETRELGDATDIQESKETERDIDILDSLDEGEVESDNPQGDVQNTDITAAINPDITIRLREEPITGSLVDSATQPMILADLPAADLAEQLRYFHVAKDPANVLLTEPVHCLVCAKEGHMISNCPALVCNTCNKYKDHFTHSCPQSHKCQKCRGTGHDKQNCPYKLPRLAASEIQCDLCQLFGHVEDDCELRWRTSGLPELSSVPLLTVSLHCFECGQAGHLGNDCPTRNPHKQMGSSTWSVLGVRPSSKPIPGLSSKLGMTIKGRAQQSSITGDSDEEPAFLRPRVAPPSRGRGKITIPHRQNDRWSGGNERTRGSDRSGRSQHYAPDPVRYDHGRQPHTRQGEYDAYRPPLPNEPPPLRKGERKAVRETDAYRPMPSAAQNAWKKRRT